MSCNDDGNNDDEFHNSYEEDLTINCEIFVTFYIHLPKNLDKTMLPLQLHNYSGSPNLDNNFRFISVIYKSVTLENFTKKVKEFQMLLKHHNALTIQEITINSILSCLLIASNNFQKILACVILAYYIETIQKQTYTFIKLRKNFPSANLLQVLQEVQTDNLLPTSAKTSFTFLTSTLV
ncbi:1747_t:CDS:2 [Dentiscutata erythropus]|uniref:1747_t:CDS:1 n=1 Tax=Dentiscutata erythropus TaxID=1348616 RepID=A0A9N9AZY5_9GLOM|nr:1747_t:CDS:2 [Dentiscutata erythropus]